MKMYSFDDKAEQIELSHAAIRAAGHEVAEGSAPRSCRRGAVMLAENPTMGGRELFREIRAAVAAVSKEDGGIITDLMFHNLAFRDKARMEETPMPPAGLLVVIECLSHGVPVVVCTDEYHHGKAVGWIFDGYVRQFEDWRTDDHCRYGGDPPPFGWVEDKDWGKAVALLSAMRARMDSPAT